MILGTPHARCGAAGRPSFAAVCYNPPRGAADSPIEPPLIMTAQGTSATEGAVTPSRGGGHSHERIVCLVLPGFKSLLYRGVERHLRSRSARSRTELILASDPFFAPTARDGARSAVKGLKHELVFRFPDDRSWRLRRSTIIGLSESRRYLAAGWQLRASGCVAFGLERWLLAVLVTHGTDPADWPLNALTSSHRHTHSGATGT